jgi:hypothetical protein
MSIALLALLSLLLPQTGQSAFNEDRYPPDRFSISEHRERFREIAVRLTQVRPGGDRPDGVVNYCSAFIETKRGDQRIAVRSFENVEPVGGAYGLFLPSRQRVPGYFLLWKRGDYDGRTILIAKTGRILDYPGPQIVIDSLDHLLISESSESEDGNVRVFDYRQGRLVFNRKAPAGIAHWYRFGNRLFATVHKSDVRTEEPNPEMWDTVYFLDVRGQRFVRSRATADMRKAVPLPYEEASNRGGCSFNR